MNDLAKQTDSTILSLMYSHHAMIQKLQHELEQLKQEAEKRKLL
jgi:AmiR/NasT family two-component response regulator